MVFLMRMQVYTDQGLCNSVSDEDASIHRSRFRYNGVSDEDASIHRSRFR